MEMIGNFMVFLIFCGLGLGLLMKVCGVHDECKQGMKKAGIGALEWWIKKNR